MSGCLRLDNGRPLTSPDNNPIWLDITSPVCSSSRLDNSNADISNGDNGDLAGDSDGIDNDGGGEAINTLTASPRAVAGILIHIQPMLTLTRL